ncbi:Ig-like domain-containing protein [Segetibacter koreensis]|uniref:Ig-like domain-containing protein n=1 Tax=Segetibacter koreensis TaxID=398037 RepID=UPI00037D5879|nr:Ig-like domain-containing protein [Segetibacter koreensis]
MKKIILLITVSFFFSANIFSQGGEIDSSFGVMGIAKAGFPANSSYTSIAVQNDKKIVVVGSVKEHFALARYNADGNLDSTFSNDGTVLSNFQYASEALSLVIQPDGKILVSGNVNTNDGTRSFTIRYNTDGTIDNSFGTNGELFYEGAGSSLAIQTDGKIVAATAGVAAGWPLNLNALFVYRFKSDGRPDSTFAGNGKRVLDVSYYEFPFHTSFIAVKDDGKIIVTSSSAHEIFIFNADGTPPEEYYGTVGSPFNISSLVIQNDGKIVTSGSSENGFSIARYNSDWSLDNTFNSTGIQNTQFGPGQATAYSMAIQPNGNIIICGSYKAENTSDFAIACYFPDGSLDTNFSTGGKQITEVSTGSDIIKGTVISGQRLYVVGVADSNGVIAAYLLDETPNLACPSSKNVPVDKGKNTAIINGIDPILTGGNSLVNYTFTGATIGTGTGSASGKIFNKGTTVVHYALAAQPLKSCEFTATVTAIPPSVIITSPINNSVHSTSATIVIDVTASDTDGTIIKVEFYNGKTLLATDDTSPYSFSWKNLKAGSYIITAKAIDNSGLSTSSSQVLISVVTNLPPVVRLIGPTNNQVFLAPITIHLEAEAFDADGRIKKVQFYNGSVLLATKKASPYQYTWINVPIGNYTISAKATDDSGAVTTSDPISMSVVPNKKPIVNITNPVEFASFAAPAVVRMDAFASDSDGTISRLEFYNDSILLKTFTFANHPSIGKTFILKDVPAGNHVLLAKATDNRGLSTTSAVHFSVVNDPHNSFLDSSFGTNGYAKNSFDLNSNFTSGAIQKDGKIVCVGWASRPIYKLPENYVDFIVTRFNRNGTFDTSFRGGTKGFHNDGSYDPFGYGFDNTDVATSVAIQTDGKIVVGGSTSIPNGPSGAFFLVCYNSDGNPDSSFGKNGEVVSDFGVGQIEKIAIQPDGKIVAFGSKFIMRYNSNGTIDNSFGVEGKVSLDFDLNYPYSLVLQKDGKILVSGNGAIVRYNVNGSIDKSFGSGGKLITNIIIMSITVDKNNRILAAGYIGSAASSSDDFAVSRYLSDGKLDESFVNKGTVITDFDTNNDYATSIVTNENEKILVGGYTIKTFSSDYFDFALVKYNSDGTPDSSFGKGGKLVTNFDHANQTLSRDRINQLVIGGDRVYAIGASDILTPDNFTYTYFTQTAVASYKLGLNKPAIVKLTIADNIVKYTAPARIKLDATVADDDAAIKKVRFYRDTTLLHTEVVSPYGFLWTNVPVGTYHLTAKAYDTKGNVITSNSIEVSVVDSNVPPVVSIVTPADSSVFSAHAKVHLIAKAKDANDKISKVEFFVGKTLLRTEYSYPYTCWWRDVQPGTYTVTAKATDDKGLSSTSDPITVTVTLQNTPMVSNRPSLRDGKSNINNSISLKLYPNPANDIISISTTGLNKGKPAIISVISSAGVVMKTIQSNILNTVVQLDVSAFSSGVYTVKILSEDKIVYKQFSKL